MSSDEEPLDSFYENYQRRLDGLPGLPPQQNSTKGKQRAFNDAETDTTMDWETANEPVSQTQATTSPSQNYDEDEDEDKVVYIDPDDRTPTPPVRHPKPQDRPHTLQNVKFSESRFRTPLRNLNTRGRTVHSSTRGRGRNFGPSRHAIPRSPRRNRNVYVPPHRPTLPRQTLPLAQSFVSRGRSPARPTPIPDIPEVPEPYQEEPFRQPRPSRYFARAHRQWRPPETIRLTDGSHYIPEREDMKWSNRRYEKSSGRFIRKSKGVAFLDTFKGTFAPHRPLRFGPQRRSRERDDSEEEDAAEEETNSEEGHAQYEEDDPDDAVVQDLDDDAALDAGAEEVIVMSPPPNRPPKQLYQAIKQVIEISDDSDPESVENSNGSISDGESSSTPSIEEYEPEPKIAHPLPEQTPRPPEVILEALRPSLPASLSPKLPFLRRNLKRSFYHTFIHHITQRQRPTPKIPFYTKLPSIHWTYLVAPDADPWQVVQQGWSCQLCNSFPPFALGSALMYHLQRDHSSFVARRKKLGVRMWSITVIVFRSVLPAPSPASNQEHSTRTPDFSFPTPTSESITENTDLDDGDQTDDTVEQLAVAMMDLDTDGEVKRYRVGGIGCYDLAMQEMAMPLKGLAAKTLEGRENDVCFYTKCSDKEKAMAIIWGRWISQHRLEFIRNPLKNTMIFIDKHWEIIHRTAEQEGLIRWLLAMKFHRYFTQAQVAQLSKRHREYLPDPLFDTAR